MTCVLQLLSTFNVNIWLSCSYSSSSLTSVIISPENSHQKTCVHFSLPNLLDCVGVGLQWWLSGTETPEGLRAASWDLPGYTGLLPQSSDMHLGTMAAPDRAYV